MNGFQMLPGTHNVLANWIAFELESNKVTTIKQYVSTLRSKHIDKGLPVTVFSELSITRIFTGAHRLYGAQPIHERLEITRCSPPNARTHRYIILQWPKHPPLILCNFR